MSDFLTRLTPEQWTVLGILASLVTLITTVFALWKWGQGLLRRIWLWITRLRSKVPRETVRVVPRYRGLMWYMGSIDRRPAMQVEGKWHVTNITDREVLLVKAFVDHKRIEGHLLVQHPRVILVKVYIDRKRIEGHVLVRHHHENVFGGYSILPNRTADVSTAFWIQPPVCKETQDFSTTVTFVDQFGNEHAIRNVVFKAPPPQLQQPQVPQEALHAIADPIEKDVAAVLKAEAIRYQEYGRRTGGLGSIQTTYRGQTFPSLGTEWRRADSPENQSIIQDPENARIESDNARALLNVYGRLASEDERNHFVQALLSRLSRDTEYAPVGYLILFVLFRVGRISVALQRAVRNLQGDQGTGFSDFLRLLDGLLRYEHEQFSPELMDEIERSLEGIQDHTFRIRERIAAIRAFRLAQ